MRLTRVDVLEVRFPFRIAFGHAHTSRTSSTNVMVRAETDEGAAGYGECVPRDYVTGESPASARALIAERLGPAVLGRTVERFEQTPELLDDVFGAIDGAEPSGAARC